MSYSKLILELKTSHAALQLYNNIRLRGLHTFGRFFAIFYKGHDFLFAFLNNEIYFFRNNLLPGNVL